MIVCVSGEGGIVLKNVRDEGGGSGEGICFDIGINMSVVILEVIVLAILSILPIVNES